MAIIETRLRLKKYDLDSTDLINNIEQLVRTKSLKEKLLLTLICLFYSSSVIS